LVKKCGWEVLGSLGGLLVGLYQIGKVFKGDDGNKFLFLLADDQRRIGTLVDGDRCFSLLLDFSFLLLPLFLARRLLAFSQSREPWVEFNRNIIQPCLLKRAYTACIQAARLNDFSGDDELWKCFEVGTAWVDEDLVGRQALVHIAFCLDAHILHQAAGDATQVFAYCTAAGKGKSDIGTNFSKLFIDMDYFLHALEIKIVALAKLLLRLLT